MVFSRYFNSQWMLFPSGDPGDDQLSEYDDDSSDNDSDDFAVEGLRWCHP